MNDSIHLSFLLPMPKNPRYSTSQIARLTNVHPNTVRLYEQWGYISPVPRTKSGYRVFTDRHLMEMRIARKVMSSPWAGRHIRQNGRRIISLTIGGNVSEVVLAAQEYLQMIEDEQSMAVQAKTALEKFVAHRQWDGDQISLSMHEAARTLKVTKDTLRHWERSGVVEIPRNPDNGYRCFGLEQIDRLRIVRMLSGTGYSLLAIMRIMQAVDRGDLSHLSEILDHPVSPDEILSTGDRWIATLEELKQNAHQVLDLVREWEKMIRPAV
jgi:DNA-binding transcriptional MerR regulator